MWYSFVEFVHIVSYVLIFVVNQVSSVHDFKDYFFDLDIWSQLTVKFSLSFNVTAFT